MPSITRFLQAGLAAGAMLLVGPPMAATAQSDPDILARPAPWADVMILGTFHMGEETNIIASEQADILGEKRQRELDALAGMIAAWQPTMIAVEIEPDFQAEYRGYYADWQAGGEPRGWPDEYAQIAFRVADAVEGLGAEDLYAIDRQDWNWPSEEEAAIAVEGDERLKALQRDLDAFGEALSAEDQQSLDARTLAEHLAFINSPESLQQTRDLEMRFSLLKWQEDNPGGAHTVAVFYERNLLIFQNLLKALEARRETGPMPDGGRERVLVIYGSGHAPALTDLTRHSPYMRLVPAGAFLENAIAENTIVGP